MCEEINTEPLQVSRYKAREQGFILCFESLFSDSEIDEIADNTADSRGIFLSDYAINCVKGIAEHKSEIDELIQSNLKSGWKISRISRVSYSLISFAIYEMIYIDELPFSVSINEAVELAKKYSTEDDASFVNGVLGSVANQLEK